MVSFSRWFPLRDASGVMERGLISCLLDKNKGPLRPALGVIERGLVCSWWPVLRNSELVSCLVVSDYGLRPSLGVSDRGLLVSCVGVMGRGLRPSLGVKESGLVISPGVTGSGLLPFLGVRLSRVSGSERLCPNTRRCGVGFFLFMMGGSFWILL